MLLTSSWLEQEIIAEPFGKIIILSKLKYESYKTCWVNAHLWYCYLYFKLMMTLWKSIQAQLEHDKTEILSETEILLQKFSIEQRVELQRFYDMILECSTKPIHETIYHGTGMDFYGE